MDLSRRVLIGGLGLGALGLALPRLARADAGGRRLLLITASGGWDTTRVLADLLSSPLVDTEPDAASATTGAHRWVDHPARPAVRAFYRDWGHRLATLHGLVVPSVAHGACLRLLRTGRAAGEAADFASRLAAARGELPLPHLVLNGRTFPGEHSGAVVRMGGSGQLAALLSGDLFAWSDVPVAPPADELAALREAALQRRVAARLEGLEGAHADALDRWARARERQERLVGEAARVNWAVEESIASMGGLAVEVFRQDLARCVSFDTPMFWDTHDLNDFNQSWFWDELCAGLSAVLDALASTPGTSAPTLLDETVVVVASEMARTPRLNGNEGKDHWPWTSVMMLGAGVRGGAVVGGYDAEQVGLPVDPVSGGVLAEGRQPSCLDLGATLLALGDLDPGELGEDARVLEALLER